MFSGLKGVYVYFLNIFEWKWHRKSSKSSLRTPLLDGLEIELSNYNEVPSLDYHEAPSPDYHEAPSPGSESPSGLLDGETLNVEPNENLDLFYELIYSYYCGKGLWCIIIRWICELLSIGFMICFSGFLLLYVDWSGLLNSECGIKHCDLSKEALHKHPLTPFTLTKAGILGYLGILSAWWGFCFLWFFSQLKGTLKTRHFYYNSLHVTDNELQTMPWPLVLEKVVQVQNLQRECQLSIHHAVLRLMRKENYLIGMVNKGILAFPISAWVPGVGPTVSVSPNGVPRRLVLPKTLELALNGFILQRLFDRDDYTLRPEFVHDPGTLKITLMVVGFILFLLSPCLVISMLMYQFLKHAEEFYNHPSHASSRSWSNLSNWMFREFNEVDHLFKHRVNSSIVHASDYMKQFPSPILTTIARFISFVSGGFAAVLIIIAFIEESLLEGHIFGRNLFWYAAVFGTVTAISRAVRTDELLVLDPQGTMSLVVQHTHHMPKRWRGKENTESVRLEFETLFKLKGMKRLEEMASIFVTPYLLMFVVPQRVDDILQFINEFTVTVEGLGAVCSFSLFDFKRHGNRKYGSPYDSPPRQRRSSQGKLEKSFLSFQICYPSWEPDADGKKFLASIKSFRDQKLQGHTMSSRMQQNANQGNFHQFDSMWLIDVEPKNYPYILEWYYTSHNYTSDGDCKDTSSRHHHDYDVENPNGDLRYGPSRQYEYDVENPNDEFRHVPPRYYNVNEEQTPSPFMKNEAKYDGNWDNSLESRMRSHLEASTSAPLFQESVLRHHDSNDIGQAGRSQWWARTQRGPDPQTSFIEPPNFYHGVSRDNFEKYSVSDRSVEEELESQLDLRNSRGLSGTFYMDDLGFDLPFVDAYRSPSDSGIDRCPV